MDHINGTPNFSLQHLRYLVRPSLTVIIRFHLRLVPQVIDEADRLLAQSFQNWLAQVLAATHLRGNITTQNPHDNLDPKPTFPLNDLMPDGVAPTLTTCLPFPVVPVAHLDHKMTSCQKLLFSATLTRDPSKIAALDLRDPKYFIIQGSDHGGSETQILDVVMEKFSMPSTLIVRIKYLPFTCSIKLIRCLCSGTNDYLHLISETTDVFSSRTFSSSQQRSRFYQICRINYKTCPPVGNV
jgi:ATP-dependent RNA helicase DDX51/DBP6